jgi:hypothetical protein
MSGQDEGDACAVADLAAREPGVEGMAQGRQGGDRGVDVLLEATGDTECTLVLDAEPPGFDRVQLRRKPSRALS